MTTDPWADEQAARADNWRNIPEPPELTTWAEQRAKTRAAEETAAKAICATCGKRRDHEDHLFVASRLNVRCRFVEASS